MTMIEKLDELIAAAPTLRDMARLIKTKSIMSPSVANMEFVSYGEYISQTIEELPVMTEDNNG